MKITDITTTHLHSPEGKPIQDATIPTQRMSLEEEAKFSSILKLMKILRALE